MQDSRLTLLLALAACFTGASAFHLSFGHRLPLKSVNSPQLNPESHLIRPVECRNANNHSEAGICMFSIDCMQNKGVPLSICKHKYFVGTCCRLPDYNNFVGIVYDLRDTETNHVLEAREVSPSAELATQTTAPAQTSAEASDTIDVRYRISSTSLFTQTTPSQSQSPSTKASESARNADGPNNKLIAELVSDLLPAAAAASNLSQVEPMKLAPSPSETQQQQQQKHSYEIVRDVSLDSEVLGTYNSVHSPPPNAILSSKPPPPPPMQVQPVKQPVYTLHPSSSSSSPPATETTIFVEMSTPGSTTLASTTPASTTPAAATSISTQAELKSSMSTTSDQEFTLATSAEPSPAADTTQAHSSPSSSVDLISSTGAQSTTPFTVSLSTALLPNISSHAYAPATLPPATTLVFSSSSQPTKSTTPSAQSSSSSSNDQLANFSQLYSNQHSSSEQAAAAVHSSRPGGPYAASKIVTGTSSTNTLIPGLSNLQSAILSHIPFKIASGLSSYLQAAMKPTGSKPLISSNTAPSLQFQQQQQQHQANTSRSPTSATPTSTAPTSAAPALAMMAPSVGGGIRFPIDNDLSPQQQQSTVSFPQSTQQPVVMKQEVYDVVRESQRVCGRPQVQHHATTAPLSENNVASKRMARIVGGNQSSFGQWPWMVSLRQWRKGAFLHKCGAALLNENWAITAAHCVEDVKVTDLLLRLGEFDVSNQEEPYPFVERRVKVVKSHPLFNPKTFEYDLALLRFAEPIKYERNILPVCVPSGNDTYIDRMATVIGWGRLYEDGPLPDVIQHVDVPIITNNECEKMYKNAGYIEEIPDMFICAGISKGGRDSCEGDSGGPLTMVDHDGRSYLVGIISWGIGCALPSQPGVYTRITAFSGWINELAGS